MALLIGLFIGIWEMNYILEKNMIIYENNTIKVLRDQSNILHVETLLEDLDYVEDFLLVAVEELALKNKDLETLVEELRDEIEDLEAEIIFNMR